MIDLGRAVLCAVVFAAPIIANAEETSTAPTNASTTAQSPCITQDTGWNERGKHRVDLYIELTNACREPVICRVFAYVTTAKGAAQGRGTLRMDGKDSAHAKRRWTMRVPMRGGSIQLARECTRD